ncbi:MAG TPA: GDSL-type esterase/lipase family protein [Mucilaginibacter sp.]
MKKALLFSIALNVLIIGIAIGKRIYYRQPKAGKPTIVMYGDSRIAMGDWAEGLKRNDVYNAGISGATTGLLLDSLDSKVLALKPKVCIIQAGINDTRSLVAPLTTLDNCSKIIDQLKANNIQIIINSIIPISKDPFQYAITDENIINQVEELNKQLYVLAKNKGVEYLDLTPKLADGKRIKLKYTIDGVHVSPEGFKVWCEAIKGILSVYDNQSHTPVTKPVTAH